MKVTKILSQAQQFNSQANHHSWINLTLICACFLPFVSPAIALLMGMVLSVFRVRTSDIHNHTSQILQVAIVLLGFGMNLGDVLVASKSGFMATLVSVSTVMVVGVLLGKLLKVEKNIALLIACGTAICGGSAIAAIAPVLKSKSYQNSFALIVVFVLNAIALFLFPFVGHKFGLSQHAFGNWAAIAIHDTSSVVGAGAIYGEKALQIATTVKLIRALWIIPLAFVISLFNRKAETSAIKFPWFILLFVIAILFAHVFPGFHETYHHLKWLGKRGMVVALFLIGSNISINDIKQSGFRSFVLGIVLWGFVAVGSLLVIIG